MLFLVIYLSIHSCVLSRTINYRIKQDVIRRECGSFAAVNQTTLKVDDRVNKGPSSVILLETGGTAALYETNSTSRTHICGAALITNRHLLTAAHCVKGSNRTFSISLGKHELDENPSTDHPDAYAIQDVYVHPDYGTTKNQLGNPADAYHDIAILKTERDVKYGPKIWPFCLPGKDQAYDDNLAGQISGWGKVNETHSATSIQTVFIKLVKNEQCESDWKSKAPDKFEQLIKHSYPQRFNNQILCAGREGVDACDGDSGGPLAHENGASVTSVIGLISKGINCPEKVILPGIYTNVSHYVDWIEETIRVKCPEGFLRSEGSTQCFKLFADVERTWQEAKEKCEVENLKMAKPTDSVAVALRKDLLEMNGPMWLWLGAIGNGSMILWNQDDTELSKENQLWYTREPGHYVYPDYCLRLIVADYYNNLKPEQPYDVGPCPVKVNRYTLCEMTME